jgi:outer membrane receptor protein involved in Fe transport
MTRIKFLLTAIALLLFTFSPAALAQTSKGFVVGTIADPNGAGVSGATIKITNTATGVTRETTSQADGTYRLDAVDPGTYTVEATAGGFKTARRENITVAASQTAEVNVPLEVGNPSENVTISSDLNPIELQTEDGARVNTLDTKQITELPVAGLNPSSLVLTLPGVTDTTATLAGGFVQGSEFNVNGLRARANNQLIDGLDNNDNSIAGQFYIPALRDGYREVTILSSDYSAEFGRAGGAIVNIISRGGSNEFHGSAYDIPINSALNSFSPGFKRDNPTATKLPHYVENIFGFSIGGPVIKNKLFFFGTYQGDRARSSTSATGNVPTAAGFATLRALFPAGANTNVDYYLGFVGDLRGTVNPFSVALGGGRPTVEFASVSVPAAQPVADNQYLARVDWVPNNKDSFAVRYVADSQLFANQFPTIFTRLRVDVPSFVENIFVSYTRNLSSNTTNEFRFGYGRFNVIFAPPDSSALAGPTFAFSGAGLGRGITGVGLTATFPQGRIFNNFQFQDTVTHTIGNHTLRFGLDLNDQRSKQFVPINTRGSLTFAGGGGFTALGNLVDQRSGTGSGGSSIVFGSPVTYPNAFYQNYYINDQWRVRDNLTVNLGLRYENYGTPFNVVAFPAFAGFGQPLLTRAEQKRDNNNFAPRFSFAWQPRFNSGFAKSLIGENKTVIRGGFAVNYDFFFNNILSNTAATPPNAFGRTDTGASVGGRGFTNFNPGFLPTTGTPSPLAGVNTIPINLVNPISYVWNLGVERSLPFNIVGDAAYVGSRGTKLFLNEQLNPGIGPFGTLIRANPSRGSIIARTNGGDSIYHSLQLRAERGLRNGLLFRVAYTFSKAIDVANSEVFQTSGGTSTGSQYFNRRSDRSNASYDIPHALAVTFLYTLPSPFEHGFGKSLLGGFQLGGIYRIQSGAPETAYIGGIDMNGDGSGFNDRPALGNPNAPANSVAIHDVLFGDVSPTGYVDASDNPINPANARYIVDERIRTGLVARNTLRGPKLNRLDLSVTKNFALPILHEGTKFQIRADMFNALNHPFLGPGTGDVLSTDFNDPTQSLFGSQNFTGETIVGNVHGGRIIQFQLRFEF